jgi:hypothetical protein
MHALQIDLTITFIIVCVSVALVMLLRFLEVLAARSAVTKTKRLLKEYLKSREKDEAQ